MPDEVEDAGEVRGTHAHHVTVGLTEWGPPCSKTWLKIAINEVLEHLLPPAGIGRNITFLKHVLFQ